MTEALADLGSRRFLLELSPDLIENFRFIMQVFDFEVAVLRRNRCGIDYGFVTCANPVIWPPIFI